MSQEAVFVNVNMTIKLNDASSIKYLQEAIEFGMEFDDSEGVVYFDTEVQEEINSCNKVDKQTKGTAMIFVTTTQSGHTDSTGLHGPFTSIDEAKMKVTDDVDRGIDGDETRYTFFEATTSGTKEVGYVLLRDECDYDEDNLKEEYFPNN